MKTLITIITAVSLGGAFTFAADPVVPKDYPLKTCVVSSEPFGGDMIPHKVTHEGTDVWLCCKRCKGKFDKEPAKYTQKVKDAAAKK